MGTNINDAKLVKLIKFAPTLMILTFAVAVNSMILLSNKEKSQQSIESLENDIIATQKQQIQSQVNQAIDYIEYRYQSVIPQLKKQSKQRVYEAIEIAENIYQKNRDKPDDVIKSMIINALRPIRYAEKRGYFFIFQMDGMNVMHPLKTHLEGQQLINAQDQKGTLILKEHIDLIKNNQGEAFYQWQYQKPQQPIDIEFEKLGFGKYFAHFDWFIGTGEYLDDVEDDLKSELTMWFNNAPQDNNTKFYIINQEGRIIAHSSPELRGKNINEISKLDASLFQSDIDNLANEGTHLTYDMTISRLQTHPQRVSYIKAYPEWNWVLGTSFSANIFNDYLEEKLNELNQLNQKKFNNILLLSVFSTLLIIILSLVVSQMIINRLNRFQANLEESFDALQENQLKMQHMAMHDNLTGLPNRASLSKDIHEGIQFAKAENTQLAIIFIDLFDFKKINDLYGHSSGDKFLQIISSKFESLLGEHDSIARFGGDEFIFCAPNINQQQELTDLLQRIQSILREKLIIDGKNLTAHCNIGISIYPQDGDTPESLIRKADIVLNQSKKAGCDAIAYFSNEISQKIQHDYLVEEELRKALKHNEITVHYQPQIDTDSKRIVSVEALARWHNQKLGDVPPIKFIETAEQTGLIIDIGLFIFKTTCKDILSVSSNGHEALCASINISPKQLLCDGFVNSLIDVSDEVGINRERITLEITENVFIDDVDQVTPILDTLRNVGFGISLDDFGTGYSSLSYLNFLPITEIKIDRCFVENINHNSQSNALIEAIMAISQTFDIKVVAEGVETLKQYQTLSAYKCHLIQGYYFDKPMPKSQLQQKYFSGDNVNVN
ncbi:cache domain-containing protein [Shewanella maritima]|uniref:bifunctional diguanylate cyclase/phosphodiesterase n=1 Tax=Shewanella maritima TaxID=2520507 RepID=UPI003734E06F